jgi:hypothetical protein
MILKDLVEKAEEPYRTQMLQQANQLVLLSDFPKGRLSYSIAYMFYWNESPQGWDYWNEYEKQLIKQGL